MKLYLENKSGKTVFISLCGESIALKSHQSDTFSVSSQRVTMSLVSEDEYDYLTVSEKRGITVYNEFVAVTCYEFDLLEDKEIRLYCEKASGSVLESYQRVYADMKDGTLPEPRYCIKNESSVRAKMQDDDHKAEKFFNSVEKYDKFFYGESIFDSIVAWILLVLFGALFFAVGFMIAPVIGGIIAVLLYVGAIIIISAVIKRMGKSMEKITEKALDKVFGIFDKSTVTNPCQGMPDIWKDDNSYFDNEYISAVFKYSLRREQL